MKYRLQYVIRRALLIFFVLPLIAGGIYFLVKDSSFFDRMTNRSQNPPKRVLPKHFQYSYPDSIPDLQKDSAFDRALFYQSMYLLRPQTPNQPTKNISKKELLKTLHLVQNWESFTQEMFHERFDFYRVQTSLKGDRVRMTGYYTPVITVHDEPTPAYPIAFLKRPDNYKGEVLDAAVQKTGSFMGENLSLAWASSLKVLKNAQLQGSAFVEFLNGKTAYFAYGGEGRMANAAGSHKYIFFKEKDSEVMGAGGFPLTPMYSVAVDTRFIPLGACLLAEVPEMNEKGKVIGVRYRLLFAQDTGGAIKHTKKLDLYCGVGQKGRLRTHSANKYCKLWLLLPREKR